MKRVALAALVLCAQCGLVAAEGEAIRFQGIEMGAPLPASITPTSTLPYLGSAPADDPNGARPEACQITVQPEPGSDDPSLAVFAEGCDGPVRSISAVSLTSARDRANGTQPQVPSGITGLTMNATTLADLRETYCSDGLIPAAGATPAQDDRAPMTRVYGVEGTELFLVLVLDLPIDVLADANRSVTQADRDNAMVHTITLMDRSRFERTELAGAQPSPGYVPLPQNLFGPAGKTPNCSGS